MYQGENSEDRVYDEPVEVKVEAPQTTNCNFEFLPQETQLTQLDQIAQDLDIATKSKSKKGWRQNAANNTHTDNIRSPLRLLTSTGQRMKKKAKGELLFSKICVASTLKLSNVKS